MPIEWTDEYSVGVQILDAQHKRLIAIINRLEEQVGGEPSPKVLQEILQDLVDYTCYHFQSEEELFEEYDYEEADSHRAEHIRMVYKLDRLRQAAAEAPSVVADDLLLFLKSWLKEHILESDRAYKPHLNGRGVY